MAHGNRRKALERKRRAMCETKRTAEIDLSDEVHSLIGEGESTLSICRRIAQLRREAKEQEQGRQ